METPKYKTALIVGAGEGLSASLARLFAREGLRVALAARAIEKLGALCTETKAQAYACNATEPDEVERLFGLVEREIGTPDVVVYNASARARGPADRSRSGGRGAGDCGQRVWRLSCGPSKPRNACCPTSTARSCSRARPPASRAIRNRRRLRWGSSPCAGLAQSMARELSPQGLHIAHFVIDGGIRSATRVEPADRPDSFLDPDAIALSYWNVLQQPRSAWTWEVELRPWVEKF